MGMTAIVSSTATATSAATDGVTASVTTMLSPIGAGVGGVFIAAALIVLLAYLDLLDAAELDADDLRTALIATIYPLVIVFASIVAFRTLELL